jgi:hypothetical protein
LSHSDEISFPEFLDKSRVSGSVFRGKISTVIPHPVDTNTSIIRLRVSKFIKGCGDDIVNLYITRDDSKINRIIEEALNSTNRIGSEVLIFACARDDNGIGWDLSEGLGGDGIVKWDFKKYFQFEKELENEYGCINCCESAGECGTTVEEAENLTRMNRARKRLNESNKSKEDIGDLIRGFGLGRNKKGINVFFNDQ